MIFDKDLYDRSLWLMMKSDKDNSEKIIDFIKCMPVELYNQIKNSIEVYKKDVMNSNCFYLIDDSKLSGKYETSRHVLYWYKIDYLESSGTLSLGYSILYGDMYYDVVIMKLIPYDDMYQLKYFDDEKIGYLMYDITTTQTSVVGKETDYNIINTPIGNIIISKRKDRDEKYRFRLCRVNMNRFPDEIYKDDFVSRKSIKKLIRGKKIK